MSRGVGVRKAGAGREAVAWTAHALRRPPEGIWAPGNDFPKHPVAGDLKVFEQRLEGNTFVSIPTRGEPCEGPGARD